MALDLITVGAKVIFRPQELHLTEHSNLMGFILPDVNSAPEVDDEIEAIDVSNTEDTITRYKIGRKSPSGNSTFVLNHTDNVLELWKNALSVLTENGYKACWEYYYPEAQNSYFWAGEPARYQGSNGIEQNSLSTLPLSVATQNAYGWHSKGSYGWGFSPNTTGSPENRYIAAVSVGATSATLKIKAPAGFSEVSAEPYAALNGNLVTAASITDDPELAEQTISVTMDGSRELGAVKLTAYDTNDNVIGEWVYWIIRKR